MWSGLIKARVDEFGSSEDFDWFCCTTFVWFWDNAAWWECCWGVEPLGTGGGMAMLEFVVGFISWNRNDKGNSIRTQMQYPFELCKREKWALNRDFNFW